jgi:hypothetical protein
MRCPLGLIFDDLYQRCEWPGSDNQSPNHRLSSLRDKKNEIKKGKKQLRLMTTKQQQNSTVSSLYKIVEP